MPLLIAVNVDNNGFFNSQKLFQSVFLNLLILSLVRFDFCKHYITSFPFSDILSSGGVAFENRVY